MRNEITPVTALNHEIYAKAPIDDQLPFVFPITKYTLSEMNRQCSHCNRVLRGEFFRGDIVMTDEKTAHMRAIGMCSHCNLFTRFKYDFHDDSSVSRTGEDGKKEHWKNQSAKFKKKEAVSLSFTAQVVAIVAWPLYVTFAYAEWALKALFGNQDKQP